ncbi:MAG: hypothetical protein GTO40_17175, partial [Deltaproteobacteria bacterium]|nr:hypothetical protein [Deltaproteobacteria bacterium]
MMVLPLLFACFYTLYSFHTSGWITAEIAIFTLSGTVGILLALALRVGSEKLPLVEVAQFIDHRVRGKDRFVTLTTIDSSRFSTALLQRLRSEAARLLQRLDLRRDFPYRFRKSFFASMLVSLALVGLSQVMLNLNVFRNSLNTSLAELSAVAQELSQDPLAAELGHQLMELKSRIENKGLQDAGNEKMINELRRQMRYQLAAGDESGDGQGELLRQAARTLQNLAESRESGKRPRVDSRMAKGGEGGDTGDKGSRRDKRQSGDETTKGNNQGGEESDFQITKQQPGKNEREKSQLGGMEMPRDAAGKNGGKGVGPGRESQEKGPEE